ncbi:MAG: Fic family protein [Proteobacteria bacterium]|nr:Fic family protein [Pseudomonadota bacterium]
MYRTADDIYCYPRSTILKNLPGLRNARALKRYELAMSAQRAEEPLPAGRLSVTHYRAIHRHLFQDVYDWSGQFRRVRIARGTSMFCYPENIGREMSDLFGQLAAQKFFRERSTDACASELSHFLATLNAIHPFRDGNGRSQLAFGALLAHRAGHPLRLEKLRPRPFLSAMIESFQGNEAPLASNLRGLMDG